MAKFFDGRTTKERSEQTRVQMTGKFGPNAHNWKGGGVGFFGYHMIGLSGKQRPVHRLIMEVHLGRKLSSNEIVHHIDENKLNNNIENLQLVSRSEHMRIHKRPRRQNVCKDICIGCKEYKVINYLKHNACTNCYRKLIRLGVITTQKYKARKR